MNRFLHWLSGHMRCRLIARDGEPHFLERYSATRWIDGTMIALLAGIFAWMALLPELGAIAFPLVLPVLLWFFAREVGWKAYLHRMVGSDPDDRLHNHPWTSCWSLVLSGWFFERRRQADGAEKTVMRKAGRVYRISEDTYHRIVLPIGSNGVWTLFLHSPRARNWGFVEQGGIDIVSTGKNRSWTETAPYGRNVPDRCGVYLSTSNPFGCGRP